jgi:cystathionine beta-lyase
LQIKIVDNDIILNYLIEAMKNSCENKNFNYWKQKAVPYMKYDFSRYIKREGTDSYKWDCLELRFGTKDIIPMWVADMDFLSPAPVVDALKKRAEHGIYGYTIRSPSFYNGIVDWMEKRHQWKIKPEWIEYSPGVVPSVNLAIQAFTHPGDKIIIQPPVYHPFFKAIRNNGRQIVINELKYENGKYEMDFDDLKDRFDERVKMLILCSPHNPVGRVWAREELAKLGKLCLENNVIIVSDEIHSDLILKGYKHIPTASTSSDVADITLTFEAPSKTFNLAGLANSTVIASNPKFLSQFKMAVENVGLGFANAFGVVASEAAYMYGEEWLEQLLEYIQGNVDYLTEYLKERVPEIRPVKLEGTYLVWLDCKNLKMNTRALNDFMIKNAKVGLDDGQIFGPGGEGFQRMNIACPKSILTKALTRIERAVKELKK